VNPVSEGYLPWNGRCADKIGAHLRTLFTVDAQPQDHQPRQWGQASPPPRAGRPGDNARRALEKRYGQRRQ
jgi:hypothetical protein